MFCRFLFFLLSFEFVTSNQIAGEFIAHPRSTFCILHAAQWHYGTFCTRRFYNQWQSRNRLLSVSHIPCHIPNFWTVWGVNWDWERKQILHCRSYCILFHDVCQGSIIPAKQSGSLTHYVSWALPPQLVKTKITLLSQSSQSCISGGMDLLWNPAVLPHASAESLKQEVQIFRHSMSLHQY